MPTLEEWKRYAQSHAAIKPNLEAIQSAANTTGESTTNDKEKTSQRQLNTLNSDLWQFADKSFHVLPKGNARNNVWKLLTHMYETPITKITPRYTGEEKVIYVADLCMLSEREIENFAYKKGVRCGPKTLDELKQVLNLNHLPGPLPESTD